MREELRKEWNEMLGEDQEHRLWFAKVWRECFEQVGFNRAFVLWAMKNHGTVLREFEEYNRWIGEIYHLQGEMNDGGDGV